MVPTEHGDGTRFGEVLRALREETDRGCALVGAVYLDDALEGMLRARLSLPNDVDIKIFGFRGALGSLSDRIDLAYSVGLLQPSLRKSLHMARRIRNEFAHEKDTKRFRDEQIANRLRELFDVEREYMAVAWNLLAGEVPALRDATDPTVSVDARRFVELVGARAAFEVYVAQMASALEESVAAGNIEKLSALPEIRTY